MTTRRRFSDKFKATVALEALRGDRTVQEITAKHRLHPTHVTTWKRPAIDGLTGLFFDKIRRVEAMSPPERKAMVCKDHTVLSLTRQCKLLKISQSSLYYRSVGFGEETLKLMNEIDRVFTKYPFFGSC